MINFVNVDDAGDDMAREDEENATVIKVVGVGGAGGNAVEHMIREGVGGVEFICCNTDAQALSKSSAHVTLQLGPGLGAGGKPEKARDLAQAERGRIAEVLKGANMVFITAGMGGGVAILGGGVGDLCCVACDAGSRTRSRRRAMRRQGDWLVRAYRARVHDAASSRFRGSIENGAVGCAGDLQWGLAGLHRASGPPFAGR